MNNNLTLVEKSYDKAIALGKDSPDPYKNLPDYITNDPDYKFYEEWINNTSFLNSGSNLISEYLSPAENMNFIDLGCSVNLITNGYDKWSSLYHGVDISGKTIQILKEFITHKDIKIGTLHHKAIHETSFCDNNFDIGACIGVLEYLENDLVISSIVEANRILKPNAKFVLDIPNIGNSACNIMAKIEDHLERPNKFNLAMSNFEDMILNYFNIVNKFDEGAMVVYFLECNTSE